MSAPLYNTALLKLAATIPHTERLADPHASVEKRSPICGSRVTVDVKVDDEGRITELGQLVRACALGQASASLMGAAAIGRDAGQLAAARDALADWLAGVREDSGGWPGLDVLAPARDYPARHASIRLAFEAVAEAAETAARERR
jgi:NifU-like protein involved in Fe-S cluster formation